MLTALIVSICLLGSIKDTSEIRSAVIGGNVRTKFFNYAELGGPDRVDPWPRMEWPAGSGHEYLYNSGLVIGAKVRAYDPSFGDSVTVWIVDDGVADGGDRELLPVGGFADPNSDTIALSTSPITWPSEWPDYVLAWGDTVHGLSGGWPGDFGAGNIIGDQESFWVMSDSANVEFLPGNSNNNPCYDPGNGLAGLGLIVYGRSYVVNLGGVNNAVIFTYTIHNVSEKRLDSLTVGVVTNVRIGGPGSDFDDDRYDYNASIRTLRFYDDDGIGVEASGNEYQAGQLGIVFLQTPGNSHDGIDNDHDGMVDESPADGIDNDGDWNAATDDVGRDGIPNTGDEGEGDGVPTPGEPNFEWRDPDEIDEIGMSAVDISHHGSYFLYQDAAVGERMEPGHFWPADSVPMGDYVTLGSSGFFSLEPGQWTKFAVAYVMVEGQTWDDLLSSLMKVVSYYRGYLGVGLRGEDIPSVPLEVIQPSGNDVVSGDYEIRWNYGHVDGYADILLSTDNGLTFDTLASGVPAGQESYTWHTRDWPDGSLYRMILRVISPLRGMAVETTAVFTVNNSDENGIPGVVFLDVPQVLQGETTFSLLCGDPESDEFILHLLLSYDGQRSWQEIDSLNLSTERETLNITFDTREFPNTEYAYLMAIVESPDGRDTSLVGPLSIHNYRHLDESDSAVVQISGPDDGEIHVYEIGNPATTDTFMITFESQPNGDITYSVRDISSGTWVFENYPLLDGLESPMFYNMALEIRTIHDTICDDSASGHIAGNSNFDIRVMKMRRVPGSIPDYLIIFHNERIGKAIYRNDTVNVNFIVEDLWTGDTILPWFPIDVSMDTLIADSGDEIVIFSGFLITWAWDVKFICDPANPIPPAEGDTFYIRILSPLSERDTFLLFPDRLVKIEERDRMRPAGRVSLMVSSILRTESGVQFRLALPKDADVSARLFDVTGRMVTERAFGRLPRGTHGLSLKPQSIPSGVYFLEVNVSGRRILKRLVMIR